MRNSSGREAFFSSVALLRFARTGRATCLPRGHGPTRNGAGGVFFEDLPFDGQTQAGHLRDLPQRADAERDERVHSRCRRSRRGGRFQTVCVSEFNAAGNPVIDFVFHNADGTATTVSRARIPAAR